MNILLKYCKALSLVFLILGCQGESKNEGNQYFPYEIKGEITDYYRKQLSKHLKKYPEISKDSIVLLGDSLLEGMPSFESSIINYGISQDTSYGLLTRVPNYRNLDEAQAIVLAIGVNDIWRGRNNEDIAKNIELTVNILPDNVPILLYGLLPVDERVNWAGWNKRILEINRLISLKVSKQNVHYIESQSIFSNENGNLKAKLHEGDGVHLSEEGYSLWWKNIKTKLTHFGNEQLEL